MEKKNSSKNDADNDLDEIKIKYKGFKEKYDLPEFYELNKLFDIEEVDSETEFFLRKLRRTIADRISAYIRFVEIIINPSNAPLFFFKLVKKLGQGDKEKLSIIYDKLSGIELDIISLDLDYSEENEAEFIKNVYNLFEKDVRHKLIDMIKKLSNESESNHIDNHDSYFG